MKINNNHIENYSVIILAGGSSTRMKFPKPWLLKGNTTFLSEIVNSYTLFGIKNIVVVLNEKFSTHEWENELTEIKAYAEIIKNYSPEKGRLYSLQLGLKNVMSDAYFIHNVDNPFIEKKVLEELINQIGTNEIVIPSYKEKGGHPVVVSNAIKNEIINNYQNYKTLKQVFLNFPKKYVEVSSSSILKNINTPKDLAEQKYELT